jgi:glycyl-tRNA synthetase (class II)
MLMFPPCPGSIICSEVLVKVCSIKPICFCSRASGHVDRFADLMVKDVNTGECFRLDHLIKAHLEKFVADKKTVQATRDECQDIIVRVNANIHIVYIEAHIPEFRISFTHKEYF